MPFKQSKKRQRAGTPEKTRKSDEMLGEIGEDYAAFCLKCKQEAEKMSVKTVKDLKEGMEKMFSSVLIPYLEKMLT
jgi:hypothetical protein